MERRGILTFSIIAASSVAVFFALELFYFSTHGGSSDTDVTGDGLSPYRFTSASNCARYSDCEEYCSNPSHADECNRFFSRRSSDAGTFRENNLSFVNVTGR